jgi:hypothetical protein
MTNLSCVCRVCGSNASFVRMGDLLDIAVGYYECGGCKYVQTESPYWLEKAYSNPINDSDTGIVSRNQTNARMVLGTMATLGKLSGAVADCAGGYGILVRMLRDLGVEASWSDRYCQNLFAKGFEHVGQKVDLVTSFEAFEHFVSPADELDRMLSFSPNVLLSTELIPSPSPAQDDWWYYGKEHGQHIGFFRVETLAELARSRGKYLLTDGRSYHLFTDRKINLSTWEIARAIARFAPRVFTGRLRSKTWPDHEAVVRGIR